jgi:hypothetical protein
VADAVVGGEVAEGRFLAAAVDEAVDVAVGPVSEEDGPGLGGGGFYVVGAVEFFVGAGVLVFFDAALLVFVEGGDGYEADLDMGAHLLLVDVEAGGRVLAEPASGDEVVKGGAGFFVDGRGVVIDVFREVDFGFGDPEEAVRVGGGYPPCFGRVHDVVGEGGDAGGQRRIGPEAAEGFDCCHGDLLSLN